VVTSGPTLTGLTNQFAVTYTINVTNTGGATTTYTLTDTPLFGAGATVDGATCVPSGAGAAACGGTVTGLPVWTVAPAGTPIASGGAHTYTITVTFSLAPAEVTDDSRDCSLETGSPTNTGLLNRATLTPPVGGPVNRDACRERPQASLFGANTFSITKVPSAPVLAPDSPVSFTMVVTNNGPDPANGSIVTDPAVQNFTASSVTCGSPTNGAACPAVVDVATLQGGGLIVATFPANSSITLVLSGMATLESGDIVNTVTVSPPAGVPISAVSATAIVSPAIPEAPARPIPTLSQAALLLLMLLLAGIAGGVYLRRSSR
jgi:uncharacterized repeat protein (TIGR01451 family)